MAGYPEVAATQTRILTAGVLWPGGFGLSPAALVLGSGGSGKGGRGEVSVEPAGLAMKRVWGFGREKGLSPLGSASGLQRQGRGVGQEKNRTDNLLLGYHVRDRDLRKIHKAACVGNVAQVQQILLLGGNGVDDRDKMNR